MTNTDNTAPKFYIIDGFKIEVETPEPSSDVRFMSQRQLLAINNQPAALAELISRAAVINARKVKG